MPDGLSLHPGLAVPHLLAHAALAFHAGRLAEAERLCRQALDRAPGDGAARRQLGLIRLVGGDPASCLALLTPLQESHAGDVDLAIGLAEASWATGGAAGALPHYRRALALDPGRVRVRARFGLALLTAGEAELAVTELERVVRQSPDAPSLTHLGMALLTRQRPAEAAGVLAQAAALDPSDPGSVFHLGQALRDLGRTEEAIRALAEAVRRGPDHAHLHLAHGDALAASGAYDGAREALRQATALDPAQPLAWAKLGDIEQMAGDPVAALGCYRRAAALDPDDPDLLALLGNALVAAGEPEGARALGRSMAVRWAAPARGAGLRVGVLAAPGGANTPTGFIVDRARLAVSPVFLLDGFDYPHRRLAESYDVLFNAVSDADAAPGALTLAAQLAAATGLPVANSPDAIPATTREQTAARLSDIAGLHVPRTERLSQAEVAAWATTLAPPVLVRAPGSHGGRTLGISHTVQDAQRAAAALPSSEVYVTEFVEFRSADGLYRKLRIVFVDGRPFPVHLAIGEQWLSHYFRTRMAERAEWRAEEAAFLADHEGFVGDAIGRALRDVAGRVGLDYFGIDGAIGRDGRLVLFECNAAMLVRHAGRPAMFDYKREPAERIRRAVGDMLARLAARAPEAA